MHNYTRASSPLSRIVSTTVRAMHNNTIRAQVTLDYALCVHVYCIYIMRGAFYIQITKVTLRTKICVYGVVVVK